MTRSSPIHLSHPHSRDSFAIAAACTIAEITRTKRYAQIKSPQLNSTGDSWWNKITNTHEPKLLFYNSEHRNITSRTRRLSLPIQIGRKISNGYWLFIRNTWKLTYPTRIQTTSVLLHAKILLYRLQQLPKLIASTPRQSRTIVPIITWTVATQTTTITGITWTVRIIITQAAWTLNATTTILSQRYAWNAVKHATWRWHLVKWKR